MRPKLHHAAGSWLMLIPTSRHNVNYNFNPTFNGSLLKIVNTYKYLGSTVDNQLKFKFYTQLLEKKFVESVFLENKAFIIQANFINVLLPLRVNTTSSALCHCCLGLNLF